MANNPQVDFWALIQSGMLKSVSHAKHIGGDCMGEEYESLTLTFPNGQTLVVRSTDADMHRSSLDIEIENPEPETNG